MTEHNGPTVGCIAPEQRGCAWRAPTGTVPKHDGLTMLLVPLRHPGIMVNHIRQVGARDVGTDAELEIAGLNLSNVHT
jgi:hypothetical protein